MISQAGFTHLFNAIADAIIVFDSAGKTIYENDAFSGLPSKLKIELIDYLSPISEQQSKTYWLDGREIKRVELEAAGAFIISHSQNQESAAEITLRKMSAAMSVSEDIYVAAAKAISACLTWRWVAITRFKSRSKVEVLAFLDTNNKLEQVDYDLVGTPCESVFDTNKFTMFSDVNLAFPNYQALNDMGAKTYAGLVYRGADNQPLGHIMAMHDCRDVDFALAEDVISVTTLALSSHFQLQSTTSKLQEVEAKIKIDGMTNVGNRYAYETQLSVISEEKRSGNILNWTVAIVDLDNLKPLNDQKGHQSGDKFIKLMAAELAQIGRQGDFVFRIGGDEFALLFNQSSPVFISVLENRIKKAIQRVRLALAFHIDASMGCALLSEVDGDIEACVALADKRMYDNKTNKKMRSGVI